MKKLICLFLLFLLLLAVPPAILARATPSSTKIQRRASIQQRIEEKKELIQQKHEQIRERIEEKKATRSARLAEARKVRVRAFWARLEIRFLAVITRLETLIERIESRLAQINEESETVDTDFIETQLAEASGILDAAKIELEAAGENIENILLSQDPKSAFEVIKESVRTVRNDLVEAHRILVHVIGDIKGLRVGNASSVVSTETPPATSSAEN